MRMAIGCPARTLRFLVLATVLVGLPCGAWGSTLLVTDLGDTGGPGQLRSLISAAAPGDTIVIPPGTIVITGAPGENANVTGDLDILKDLTIVGAGAALTVIDANHVDRVFDVASTVTASISGLTIRNGYVDPAVPFSPSGGGLLNRGVSTTLADVVIEDNYAGGGGGIANFGGTVRLIGSTVRNNSSTGVTANGGGISNFGNLEVTHSTVSGNTVFGTSASTLGGGIINVGTLVMSDSTVVANTASGNFGGGLYQTPYAGTLALANVTIADNQAGVGKPYAQGGGLANAGAALVTIVNTLIAGNVSGPGTAPDCSGTITSLGHNLVQSTGLCTLAAAAGDILDRRAGLRRFGDNGGPTETYSLRAGSRAVDAGDGAACASLDQRGVARPADGDDDGIAVCDIGAFELTR
jgi:hypothetical protein